MGISTLAAEVTNSLVSERHEASDSLLTNREQEVLTLIVNGASNNEVGFRLQISQSTVKTYVRNIFTKLGVSSRAEAVAYALRNDLV